LRKQKKQQKLQKMMREASTKKAQAATKAAEVPATEDVAQPQENSHRNAKI
jgi:hypothetical protein